MQTSNLTHVSRNHGASHPVLSMTSCLGLVSRVCNGMLGGCEVCTDFAQAVQLLSNQQCTPTDEIAYGSVARP
jgi:hypothetical protein